MDLLKLGELFKFESIFNETLRLLLGAFLVFILNLLTPVNVSNIPDAKLISGWEVNLLFIAAAYFTAYISYEIGRALISLTEFTISKNKNRKLKDYFSKYFESLNSKRYTISKEDTSVRSSIEAVEAFKDSVYIKAGFISASRRFSIGTTILGFSVGLLLISFILKVSASRYIIISTLIVTLLYSLNQSFRITMTSRKLAHIHLRKERQSQAKG